MGISVEDIMEGEKSPYQLHNFFRKVRTKEIVKDYGATIQQTFDTYEDIVDGLIWSLNHVDDDHLLRAGFTEFYSRVIHLNDGDYYSVTWDIRKAKDIIKAEKIKVETFSVDELSSSVSEKDIDWNYIRENTDKSDEPIIVVPYQPIGEWMVIDGNHRLVKKYRQNPQTTVKAYVLNQSQNVEAMAGNLYRVLYTIHHNVNMMVTYLAGRDNAVRLVPLDTYVKK